MAKLWQKNYELDSFVERFTVGNDYLLDDDLVAADCLASIAHAKMLSSVKIISHEDFDKLRQGLIQILELESRKEFPITLGDEDCHTAIENYLVEKIGESGKRIHTGRSRNDQALTALRVFGRSKIISIMESALTLTESFIAMGEKYSDVPMAGRTHMQIAMPSSIGLWAMAFAEELLDCMKIVKAAYHLNNQSPLGSAASFGVPLPLDREMSAELLGFEKVQNNVLYCNNSRGKIESIILDSLEQFMLTISKAAQELIIYSMPEFAYFSLPAKLCSGSSIMPQKKNPDVLELLRAKSATMGSYSMQIKSIIRSLPTGYNRDFQETKEPFLKGLELVHNSIGITTLTISNTEVNALNLKKGFIPEIYATDAVLKLVVEGKSFRDAYKKIAQNIDKLDEGDPETIIKKRTSEGTTGKLNIDIALSEKEKMKNFISDEKIKNNKVSENLAGKVFQIA